MLNRQVIGGLAGIILSFNIANAQNALPKQLELPPQERAIIDNYILKKSNPETVEKLRVLLEQEERKAKRWFEMFLKCNGQDGNSEMGFEYGDPDYYAIIDGKCKYIGYQGR